LGEILFTFLFNASFSSISFNQTNNSVNELINIELIKSLLETKLVNINEIKNFLNQSLLHIVSEKNLINHCEVLVKLGANCLLEDNYRQTPLLIASKSNYYELVNIFCNSLKFHHISDMYENYEDFNLIKLQQIQKSAYYAACSNNIEIVEYLFEKFSLNSEQLQFDSDVEVVTLPNQYSDSNDDDDDSKIKLKYELTSGTSELNALHVASYNSFFKIVKYLVEKSTNKEDYINLSINKFRDSTPLEEAFKGLLTLNFNYEIDINTNRRKYIVKKKGVNDYEYKKKCKKEAEIEYKKIINYLIENGAKFSQNFLINNEFSRISTQIFYGEFKHVNFIHYLNCIQFIFQYKINELFHFNPSSIFDNKNKQISISSISDCLTKMFIELLNRLYLIALKVLKDYKQLCLNMYSNLALNLCNEIGYGKIKLNAGNFFYLKERNNEIYNRISIKLSNPSSLQQLAYSKIRNSINNFGINKVDKLNLPNILKKRLHPEYKHINLDYIE
jgi:hypothetical protein